MPWGSCFLAYGSETRAGTHVLSTGRQIFIYCATREVLEQIVSACAYLKLGTSLLRGVKGLPFFSTRVEWRVNWCWAGWGGVSGGEVEVVGWWGLGVGTWLNHMQQFWAGPSVFWGGGVLCPTLQGRRYISESFPLSAASTASSFQVVADCHSLSSSYIQVAHGLFPLLGLTATSVRYQQNLIENPFLFFVVFCFLFQVTTNAGTVWKCLSYFNRA